MKFPFIKMNILQYLATKGELTGYSFMKYCKEKGMRVSNGTIYPHLKDLENAGLIQSTIDGKRKLYHLTPEGSDWIQNSTNESMPQMIKQTYVRLSRSFDMVNWTDKNEITNLILVLDSIKEDLEAYQKQLKTGRED